MNPLKSKHFLFIPLITVLAATQIFFSCSNNRQPDKKKNGVAAPVTYLKPPSSFNDTLVISGMSAVFFNPDSIQLEKIKAITENMIYESTVHDCFYQMRNSKMVVRKNWPEVKIIETSAHRYLLFVKTDNTITSIDLNGKGDMCGLFLFDGNKEPQFADMMNIDTQLYYYFKK